MYPLYKVQHFSRPLPETQLPVGMLLSMLVTSGQQREQLLQIINEGNINRTFGPPDELVKVLDIMLLYDVDTHWDSVYLMICHLCVLCLACPLFAFFVLGINMPTFAGS